MSLPEPYYERDGIVIYHGDCRDILPHVEADAVVTDPPYGIDGGTGGDARDFGKGRYLAGGWKDTPNYIREVCVPVVHGLTDLPMAVTPGTRNLHAYPPPRDIGCFFTPAAATHGPWGFTTFQPILYYGRDWRAGRGALPSGRQLTEAARKNGHPCPKPLSAWRWLVDKVAPETALVLDPFMGSGTTLVAARDLGRKAIGIEIEERYCEIAVKRLAQGVLPFGGSA